MILAVLLFLLKSRAVLELKNVALRHQIGVRQRQSQVRLMKRHFEEIGRRARGPCHRKAT
jgi:hypothetical protein